MGEFWVLLWKVILKEVPLFGSAFVEKASSMLLLDLWYLYMPGLQEADWPVSGVGIILNMFVQ